MKNIIVCLLAAMLLFLPTEVVAEKPLKTLNEYILYGLKHSAELKSAYQSYTAATLRSPQVTSLPDPTLSYGHFINSVETRVGPQNHKIGISQSFPWFGTLDLKGDIADAEQNAELKRFLSLKNRLVFTITKAYSELAYLNASIRVTENSIELVRSWEGVLTERFRTGSGTHSDLVRTQVELGKLEDRRIELSDLRRPLSSELNALINRGEIIPVILESDFLAMHSAGPAVETSMEDVIRNNPELAMLSEVVEAKKLGIDLARKKFYPDFTLGLDYLVTGDRDVAGGGDDAVLGMVSVNIPIYWSKNKAAVSEAQARRLSIEQLRIHKENGLRAELSRANYELRDSKRKIGLYKNNLIPKTRESIEASYTAYQAGDVNFLDVLESEQRLLEFQLILERSQANLIVAASKLQQISGGFSKIEQSAR